ncbi:hypothetical protein B0H10DRAFT_1223860 [Mycena sp. CBHHK59/15]|nr:hypothetical protein B0H10DRAFT_1223860 [Mycena sp. CBHHK59/15]
MYSALVHLLGQSWAIHRPLCILSHCCRVVMSSLFPTLSTLNQNQLSYNTLYATLCAIDPGVRWHWALYLHRPHSLSETQFTSYKIHATNTRGIWKRLSIVSKIGAIADPSWGVEFLESYLESIPMVIPEADRHREANFTCRVWFRVRFGGGTVCPVQQCG